MKGVIGRGWLWILVWIAVCISGCGTFSGAGEGGRVNAPVTRTVVDVQGQSVKLREKPQRIVSCSISTDEILLEMVDASRIAALSVLVDELSDGSFRGWKARGFEFGGADLGRAAGSHLSTGFR